MEKFIDPGMIRFTQASIRRSFSDGTLLRESLVDLKSGRVSAADFPPIRVFERDGVIYSLDNRRLFIFQQAAVLIRIIEATPEEVADEAFKFTTNNDGTSVVVRGGL